MADQTIIATGMPRKPIVIYGLVDPRSDEVRYVGKSDDLPVRFRSHIWEASSNDAPKSVWIRELMSVGLKPIMLPLETVLPNGDWNESEKNQIATLRLYGCKLFNKTTGGQGVSGFERGEKWRSALRASHVDNHRRKDGWQRASQKMRGRKTSDEHKEKIRASLTGRKLSPEHCRKISDRQKGVKKSPELVAKMAASLRGKKRPKHAEIIRAKWQDPDFRLMMIEARRK